MIALTPIEALAAATALVLTGLRPWDEALLFILAAVATTYVVHGFTMTVCSYLLIVAGAAIWRDRFGLESGDKLGLLVGGTMLTASFFGIELRRLLQGTALRDKRIGLFFYSASMACVLWILGFVTSYGINRDNFAGVAMMAFMGASFFLMGRGGGRFLDLWFATQPFDTQFGRFIASILRNVGMVTLIYLYVVTTFAALYYHIDNCDHTDGVCKFVNYHKYTGSDDASTRCWTFNSVAPLAADANSPDLCETHKTDKPFTMTRFLPYLYFSMVTSTTVGYGDIAPLSVSAVWLVIIHHAVSIIVLIALVAHIAKFEPTSGPVQPKQQN
jgi:hypothetical protein